MLKESDGVIARLVNSSQDAKTAAAEGANLILLQVSEVNFICASEQRQFCFFISQMRATREECMRLRRTFGYSHPLFTISGIADKTPAMLPKVSLELQ